MPLGALAQTSVRVYRIGVLDMAPPDLNSPNQRAFYDELRDDTSKVHIHRCAESGEHSEQLAQQVDAPRGFAAARYAWSGCAKRAGHQ